MARMPSPHRLPRNAYAVTGDVSRSNTNDTTIRPAMLLPPPELASGPLEPRYGTPPTIPPRRRPRPPSCPQQQQLSTALPTVRRHCRYPRVGWQPGAGGQPSHKPRRTPEIQAPQAIHHTNRSRFRQGRGLRPPRTSLRHGADKAGHANSP
jgi:hypothetical protein